jgi:hypothetical protein
LLRPACQTTLPFSCLSSFQFDSSSLFFFLFERVRRSPGAVVTTSSGLQRRAVQYVHIHTHAPVFIPSLSLNATQQRTPPARQTGCINIGICVQHTIFRYNIYIKWKWNTTHLSLSRFSRRTDSFLSLSTFSPFCFAAYSSASSLFLSRS